MRKGDFLRQVGTIKSTRDAVESLRRNPVSQHRTETGAQSGSCVVLSAVAWGSGSLCEVEVLSGGQPSGLRYADAVCPGGALSQGAVVQFNRRADGTVELVSGGGGGATTNNITQNITSLSGAFIINCGFTQG